MVAQWGKPLYFAAVVTIFCLSSSFFFLAYSQWLEIGCLPYFLSSTHGVAVVQI